MGLLILTELERLERIQKNTHADVALFIQAETLLDFKDWCMKTPGWGNVLLANRAWSMASESALRLTANLHFNENQCEAIIERLSEDPLSPRLRTAAMNAEAATNLFHIAKVDSQKELEAAWGAGWFLMTFDGNKVPDGFHIPQHKSLNVPAAKANLDFFVEDTSLLSGTTLRDGWNYRLLSTLRGASNEYVIKRAKAFLRFRKEIKYFPKKLERSDEELERLKRDIELYKAHGMKITPMENDPSFDPWKEAFRRAWYERQNKNPLEDNFYVYAVSAYKLVISGELSPLDVSEE